MHKLKTILKKTCFYSLYCKYLKKRRNVFKTNYNKNVLISYIISPFINDLNLLHTNNLEALAIAEVFNKLGYNVDIYDYSYDYRIDYSKYNVIFGFGRPLEKSFYNYNDGCKRIFYGTGLNHVFNNYYSLNRIREVYDRKNHFLLKSARIAEETWPLQLTLSNYMILLGNDYVKKTYSQFFNNKIFMLNVSSYKVFDASNICKNFNKAKYNFLWFGSSGLIHKGLDLVLDEFSQRDNVNLFVCGNIDNEKEFVKCYYDELYNKANIHTIGFINLKSDEFYRLAEKCAFVIVPSCAEANCTSVINCMRHGLIPIITPNCGIDVDDLGITIKNTSEEAVKESIDLAIGLDNNTLEEMKKKCLDETEKKYNISSFKKNLNYIMNEIINNDN